MNVSGNVIQRVKGEANSNVFPCSVAVILLGVICTALFASMMSYASSDEEEFVFFFCIMLGVLCCISGIAFPLLFSKGRLSKSWLEIRTDGVVIQPLKGDLFHASYEDIRQLSISKSGIVTQVIVEGNYGQKGVLFVKNSGRASEICDQIKQAAQKHGVKL